MDGLNYFQINVIPDKNLRFCSFVNIKKQVIAQSVCSDKQPNIQL